MAIIPLRAYNREIEGLIDSRQLDEAVAHCRQILATFPKHIATYRLLGKAHLEQQRISDATDIFQRVLSSVPDDFVANVGMSIIREDENNLDSSIWHMEHAYEAQPSNVAIQDELRRLYGRRDGVQPPKVRLTRGALARMYAKGGLYDQAVPELRAAISEDPNRPDLQLLLAEMFFQTNQRVEAVETCANLLKKMPLCLEANRILAISLPEAEGSEAVKNYRQIVISMDPYYAFAAPDAISSDQVPENAVNIERLDYKSGIQVTEAPVQPNWATSLGISVEKPMDDNMPEWLRAAEAPQPGPTVDKGPSGVSPFIWDTQEVTNIIAGNSKPETEIPEWMKDAGWQPATGPETPPPPVEASVQPTPENTVSDDLEKAEIPEWLQGIAPEGAAGEEKPAEGATESNLSTPWLEQHQPGPTDSIIHWLEDNKPEKPRSRPPREEAVAPLSEDEVPEWLKDLEPAGTSATSSGDTKVPGPAFTVEPGALGGEPEKPETPFLQESSVEMPFEEMKGQSEEPQVPQKEELLPGMPVPAEVSAESVDEIPDWLKELAGEPPAAEESAPPAEAAPAEEPVPAEAPEIPEPVSPPLPGLVVEEAAIEEQPAVAEQPIAEESPPTEEIPAGEIAAEAQQPPVDETSQMIEEAARPEVPTAAAEEASLVEMPIPAEPQVTVEVPGAAEELPPLEQPVEAGQLPVPEPLERAEELPQMETPLPVKAEIPAVEGKPADEENAIGWLEDVAVEHGAKGESIPSTTEEGEIQPPEWVKLQAEPPQDELPTFESTPVEGAAVPAEEIPDWIKGLGEEPEIPPAAEAPATPAVPEIEIQPSEELPAWLRELEEPKPEPGEAAPAGEALEWKAEEMPDWLKEITETETPSGQPTPAETPATAEVTPATEPTAVEAAISSEAAPAEAPEVMEVPIVSEAPPIEIPESLEAPPLAEIAPAEVPEALETPITVEVPPVEVTEVVEAPAPSELPPAEVPEAIETPVVAEISAAELPGAQAAPAAVEVPLVEVPETVSAEAQPGILEPAPEWSSEATPPAGIKRRALEEVPMESEKQAPKVEEVIHPEAAFPVEAPIPVTEEVAPVGVEVPVRPEEVSLETFQAMSKANQAAMTEARDAMEKGQSSQAVDLYKGLIKQNYHLDEIIKDLHEALYRFPVNIDMWVTLGDAYFHTDDLSEALSAYTKAEELVR